MSENHDTVDKFADLKDATEIDEKEIQKAIKKILVAIGENPKRKG